MRCGTGAAPAAAPHPTTTAELKRRGAQPQHILGNLLLRHCTMAAPRSATLAVACFCMLAAFGFVDAQEVDILSQLFNLDSKVDDGCNKYLLVLTVSTKGPEALAATRWLFAERLAKEVPSAGPRDLIVMALEEKDDSGYVFDPGRAFATKSSGRAPSSTTSTCRPGSVWCQAPRLSMIA